MKRTAKIFNKKIIAALVVIFALLIIASSRNALFDSYREQKRWQHFEDNLQDIGYVHNGHEIGLLLEQDKKWQPTLDDYKEIYQYVYGYDLVPWRKLDGTNMSPIVDLLDENGGVVLDENDKPVKTRINLIPQWEQEYNLAVERGEQKGNVIAELRDSTRNLVVNGDLFVQENKQISQAEFLKDKFRDLLGMLIQTVWAAPFFSDTFTESSATWLPNHTPDIGTDWSHLTSRFSCDLYIDPTTDVLSGPQSVTSGGCSTSGGEGEINYVTDSLSSSNYEITVYQINGDTFDDMNKIGCRVNTDWDGYFVRWNESDADMYGCSNGVCGVVVSGSVGVADTSTVKLKCDGSSITFWENTTQLLSYTDSTFPTGQPALGMGAINNFNEDDDVDGQLLDNFDVTYLVSNNTPTITSVTDTPDPTNPSRSVTFIIDWNDADAGELVKAKVCANSSGLTNQLCDSGSNWASSTDFITLDPISLVYDIVGGDHGQTRNYYVYVCDDEAACSTVSSGTFSVNVTSVIPNIKVRGGFKLR